jgi:ABC-type sugar transport system ATPase subunit
MDSLSVAASLDPVVRCNSITKYFGGVQALANVSLSLYPGEVLCLVGDNGAGKTTLSKIICGQLHPDAGEIWIGGRARPRMTPLKALELGIAIVPQDLALCENLGASDNVMLGHEPVQLKLGPIRFLDSRRARREALKLINEVGVKIEKLDIPVRTMSGGQRQAIAISRAMVRGSKLIVFDEPTAALGVRQTEATIELIRRVAHRHVAVMVISHSLKDVMAVADRIVALRLGEVIMDKPVGETTPQEVGAAMSSGRTR